MGSVSVAFSMNWLTLFDFSGFWLSIAQTPTLPPKAPTVSEVELLKSQLQFVRDMNVAFLSFLAIVGTLLAWFFNKSLEDAKRLAREIVRQELLNHVTPLVQSESEYMMRSLKTEQVIGGMVVDYYQVAAEAEPSEYDLLKARGFLKVRFWNLNKLPNKRLGGVLVFDFVNSEVLNVPGLQDSDKTKQAEALKKRDEILNEKIAEIVDRRLGYPVLVIYTRPGTGRIAAIDQLLKTFPEIKYYTAANTPVALMGGVVDSAYVAFGDQIQRK